MVQSRFAETRYAETLTLTLTLTLTPNPNFGESGFGETGFGKSGFGESGRHPPDAGVSVHAFVFSPSCRYPVHFCY